MKPSTLLLFALAAGFAARGPAREIPAEADLPAGDDGRFVARYIRADNAAFETPDVNAGPWSRVRPQTVILLPQNITAPSRLATGVEALEVRVVHNGEWIGLAVGWEDASPDQTVAAGAFCDALAVGFPLRDVLETSPFMGGHEAGMEINHWKALWQRDIDRGYQDVTDLHPHTVADEYAGYRSEHLPHSDPASTAPMKEVMASPEARRALPAIAIGNPMSQVRRTTPVEQCIAAGFGTLSTQKQQDARANAVYQDGRWTVVITRPMKTGDPADLSLTEGMETAINFAVWDGGAGDVGGRKSYTMFTPLLIAERK